MSLLTLRFTMTIALEIVMIRAAMHVLSIRRKRLYCAIVFADLIVDLFMYSFGAPTALRSLSGLATQLILPVAMSVGNMHTRLARAFLLYASRIINEIIGMTIYALLTGGSILYGPSEDNLAAVLFTYLILTLVSAIVIEVIIAFCHRLDSRSDEQLEIPTICTFLTPHLAFVLSLAHFYPSNLIAVSVPVTAAFLAFAWVSIFTSYIILSTTKTEIDAEREIAEHALSARLARHTSLEVDALARRMEEMNELRHTLANYLRTVNKLVEEGKDEDAGIRLSELQQQTHAIVRRDHE